MKEHSKNIGMAKKLVQFPCPDFLANFLTNPVTFWLTLASTSKNEDGKVKCYNHFGKQSGNFFKKANVRLSSDILQLVFT